MAFMEAQLTERQDWYMVDGPAGTEWIPADVVGPDVDLDLEEFENPLCEIPDGLRMYCENFTCYRIERVTGYGVRSSAPGYMDCTPWTVYAELAEAQEAYEQEREENRDGDDDDATDDGDAND
jgi:hypothetical protein